MIGIGTRYTDFTTASKWIFQNPEVSYININVSNFDAYKLDAVQVVADAQEALTAIDSRLAQTGFSHGWGKKWRRHKASC